jgi:hypothetical protein
MSYDDFSKGKHIQIAFRELMMWLTIGWLGIPILSMFAIVAVTLPLGLSFNAILVICGNLLSIWVFAVPLIYIFRRRWVRKVLSFINGLMDWTPLDSY